MRSNTKQSTIVEDRALRAREAAAILGIATSTLWRWTRAGMIQNTKIGGRVTVWRMSELQRFLKEGGSTNG